MERFSRGVSEEKMERFSRGVSEELKYYVYRLIDPRSGLTFYVGKGQGNRLFEHVKAEKKIGDEKPRSDDKLKVIHAIRDAKLEVIHVVHRHGLDEHVAVEVEAALIDSFLNLTNTASGIGTKRGPANAEQLERYYATPIMEPDGEHKLLFIKTSERVISKKGDLYGAVRGTWRISRARVEKIDYILAIVNQICKGVFKADEWWQDPENCKRWGFTGPEVADSKIVDRYVGKRVPKSRRALGAQNPIQYWPLKSP